MVQCWPANCFGIGVLPDHKTFARFDKNDGAEDKTEILSWLMKTLLGGKEVFAFSYEEITNF